MHALEPQIFFRRENFQEKLIWSLLRIPSEVYKVKFSIAVLGRPTQLWPAVLCGSRIRSARETRSAMAAAFPAAEKRTQSLPAVSESYLAIIDRSHHLVTPIFGNSVDDSWKRIKESSLFCTHFLSPQLHESQAPAGIPIRQQPMGIVLVVLAFSIRKCRKSCSQTLMATPDIISEKTLEYFE